MDQDEYGVLCAVEPGKQAMNVTEHWEVNAHIAVDRDRRALLNAAGAGEAGQKTE